MELLHPEEVWRRIPPEEKFELMARAQAKGILSVVVTIGVFATISVALHVVELIWMAVLSSPLVFQFSAGRAWRSLRPTAILEHLAARSAARRFAFGLNGRDLAVQLLFKGNLIEHIAPDPKSFSFESMTRQVRENEVWIALFTDALVMLAESEDGAALEFAHLVDDKLRISGESDPGETEYSATRRLSIEYTETKRSDTLRRFTLTSQYPAALVVFEKKLLQIRQESLEKKVAVIPAETVGASPILEGPPENSSSSGNFGGLL